MLLKDYTDVMNLPLTINAKIIDIEEFLTGQGFKQGSVLNHLPLGSKVAFVEVDLLPHLTFETY